METRLIDVEVRLLIVKYGYRRILEALSKAQGISVTNIEAALTNLEKAKPTKKRKTTKPLTEIVERFISRVPENANLLRELANRFENRTFLPQMKDVRRFLGPFGVDSKSLKSRNDSAKKVFEKLSELPSVELEELVAHSPSEESAFSELADEIIGGRARSSSN